MAFSGSQPVLVALALSCWWLASMPNLHAQHRPLPPASPERELARAEALLRAFRNDSALVLTNHLLNDLRAGQQLDSPFGLRVQLVEADALERDEQDELALEKTLHVQQKSQEKGLWEVHARSCLVLALLYEKTELKARSRQQLDLAQADIDRHGLGQLYPYFAVRRSSWERIYGDKQAALFFAREAQRTAPAYGLVLEEAISHLLLNMLLPASAYNERLQHCLAAERLYQQLGDQAGRSFMLAAICSIYLQQKDFRRALAYNDSTLVAANRAITEGHQHNVIPAHAYRLRTQIYEQMGLLDSALATMRKGHELELAYHADATRDKIVEIETRYQARQKQEQLDDQALTLNLKNSQLRLSVIIGLLVLAFAIILFVAYRKQRQARQTLLEQNQLIQQQAAQLQALDAAKTRFFANVSHELRTPLTLLLGPVGSLLADTPLTNRQTHLLNLAHRNGKQLEQLVNDILDLGKLELGELKLDGRPTPVAAFFRSHLAQFESLALSQKLVYTFDVGVAETVVASLDQPKCRQLLNNLLANAFKFTSAGEYVSATLTLTTGHLHLSVADTGRGIHSDDLPHVFDRYFQTTRPNKPAEGGTGIGLALCQEYAQLFGGAIDVTSTPGAGSVFRVNFPVEVLPANSHSSFEEADLVPQPNLATDAPAPPNADQPTILVVEDNPDLTAYIRLILADRYQVITAENGQQALKQLSNSQRSPTPVSLILSDLMMPVMDGHQLLERLKATDITRHLPVIMLTARADAHDRLRALRIGVDDYLLKPFDEAELLARIENLLTNQAARQQALAEETEPDAGRLPTSQTEREWLETVEDYVRQHLADTTLSVPGLAHELAMSESTLLRQLKRLTGLTPVQYVQAVRLDMARRLLESRNYSSITQVASRVGYEDARSFARSFRARFGKSPSELLNN